MGRLNGVRLYMSGAIDRVPDEEMGETHWRNVLTPWLEERGVSVLDPCHKPIDIGLEDEPRRKLRREAKARGDWAAVEADRIIRKVDLRMVDISDAVIAYLDMDHKPCGTFEEIFLAISQRKIVMIVTKGGKAATPDWIFWACGSNLIFENFYELKEYLHQVDQNIVVDDRWMIFNKNKDKDSNQNMEPTQCA